MGLYSRARRHIDMDRVKELREEKIKQKKFAEEIREQIREELRDLNSPEFSNWRCELEEGMTSSGLFQTTLPATGEVDLAYSYWNVVGGQNYSVSGYSVTINGSPDVENGFVTSLDTTVYDTVGFDISGSNIILAVFGGGGIELGDIIITSPGTYYVPISPKSSENLLFTIAPSSGNTTISNLRYQRRTPITVFVPLDSPEATAFIRTDPMMSNLSPEERKKKLQDMLEASDEYIEKIFGENFPGTGLDPAVGEAGDTPGVEIAQLLPKTEKAIDDMLMRGLKGGDYGDPNSPAIQQQIRNLEKNRRQNTPGGVPLASTNQKYQVAHYEPQGELISEKRKLKSPQEILNKIPGYYDGKPAPLGFPVEPPPKTINGYHPDLVNGKKVSDRFNRLDPISAKSMPLTGNPHIDRKVKAARKKPK